jgi:hypothetical protein
MLNMSSTPNQVKIGCSGSFHKPSLSPIQDKTTKQIIWGKRPIVQTTMAFIGEQHYDQLHTNDGIVDIEGQHLTKWILTKHLKHNIIVSLHEKKTLEVEK